MIYTVTMNPSIDYVAVLGGFQQGQVNRLESERFYPGGKGLNVSTVLHTLGCPSTALGFVAGFTGDYIAGCMDELGIETDFIRIEGGISRINMKLKIEQESEINGMGPVIEDDHIQQLYDRLSVLSKEDILVLAGSVPRGVPASVYGEICKRVKGNGAKVLIDASGALLGQALKAGPFLVKPNKPELEQLVGRTLTSDEDIVEAAREVQKMGAEHVMVSCGERGAVLLHEDEILWQQAAKGTAVNTVGSGDSLVAGFLQSFVTDGDWSQALRQGVAAGCAAAFSEGLPEKKKIMDVLKEL